MLSENQKKVVKILSAEYQSHKVGNKNNLKVLDNIVYTNDIQASLI